MFAIAGYWGWSAIAALRREVYWLAALDALLFIVSLDGGVRILRRRRREGRRAAE